MSTETDNYTLPSGTPAWEITKATVTIEIDVSVLNGVDLEALGGQLQQYMAAAPGVTAKATRSSVRRWIRNGARLHRLRCEAEAEAASSEVSR